MTWRRLYALAGVLLGLLWGVQAVKQQYIEDTDRFPGWKGELPNTLTQIAEDGVGFGELGKELWRGRVEQISWRPRAFIYHNFLSEEECDHLIALARDKLRKSSVVDNNTGKSFDSDIRTSSGMFMARRQDEVIARIEKRISMITMLPEENGEGLQILKYVDGQKYEPHLDAFHDPLNARAENGGQRIATVLMYLTTPEAGGETVFPEAETKVSGPGWSDCALRGLAVKATRGNALLFYSLQPSGEMDTSSKHGSCPTLAGEKWSATKWIHVGGFRIGQLKKGAAACTDDDKNCAAWAASGECERNSGFMYESCRKSCGLCQAQKVGGRRAAAAL